MARFEKDFRHLTRQIDSLFNGQIRVNYENTFDHPTSPSRTSTSSDSDESPSNQQFFVEITPYDGPYAHASYIFRIEVSSECDYPESQPIVSCLTRIYHPNIDTTYGNYYNNVCVSTLNDWDGGVNCTLEQLVQSLIFLFHSPNPDDPLTSNVTSDEEEFLQNVRISIEGGVVEDFDYESFPINYGYERYLNEQQKKEEEVEEEEKPKDCEEDLEEKLIEILTREPNFKQIFTSDTLEFLSNNPTTPTSPLPHSTRHYKETTNNS